jgi:hypothetical protein
MHLENLFPIPVGFFNYDEGLSEDELTFLLDQPQRPNDGNTSSIDRYILKQKTNA